MLVTIYLGMLWYFVNVCCWPGTTYRVLINEWSNVKEYYRQNSKRSVCKV